MKKTIAFLMIFSTLILLLGGCSNKNTGFESSRFWNDQGVEHSSTSTIIETAESSDHVAIEQQLSQETGIPETEDIFYDVGNRYMKEHAGEIYGSWWLPSGGILLANPAPERSNDSFTFMEWVVLDYLDGEIKTDIWSNRLQVCGYKEGAIHIFYDEDWEARIFDDKTLDCTYYDSCFFWHTGYKGTEAIIIVIPNVHVNLMGLTVPYEKSEFYQQVPTDSLDTVPIEILYPGYNYDYPVWIFAIDEKKIDKSYEMHYLDYVLTGGDILSNTWSIGNAPPITDSIP